MAKPTTVEELHSRFEKLSLSDQLRIAAGLLERKGYEDLALTIIDRISGLIALSKMGTPT